MKYRHPYMKQESIARRAQQPSFHNHMKDVYTISNKSNYKQYKSAEIPLC